MTFTLESGAARTELRAALSEIVDAEDALAEAIQRKDRARERVRQALAVLGAAWTVEGVGQQDRDRDLLEELYWDWPQIKVEWLARAWTVRDGATNMVHTLVKARGEGEIRCRVCGQAYAKRRFTSREQRRMHGRSGDLGCCGVCAQKNRAMWEERQRQREAEWQRFSEDFDRRLGAAVDAIIEQMDEADQVEIANRLLSANGQ